MNFYRNAPADGLISSRLKLPDTVYIRFLLISSLRTPFLGEMSSRDLTKGIFYDGHSKRVGRVLFIVLRGQHRINGSAACNMQIQYTLMHFGGFE